MTAFTSRSVHRPAPATVFAVAVVLLASIVTPADADRVRPPGGGPGGRTVVRLAPGTDALAAAIEEAGEGGTVLLQAGVHRETASVAVERQVALVGEPGAVLESAVAPGLAAPIVIDAALHVRASGTRIVGLTIRPPAGAVGGTAIVIDHAAGVEVAANTIAGFQYGVLVQRGDDARVSFNRISIDPGWQTGALPDAHGIVVINGLDAVVDGNTVEGGLFGIWACDRGGRATGNEVSGALAGIILCKVPDGNYLISGVIAASDFSGTGWSVDANNATGNSWGYLVIDGANGNRLWNNDASGNAVYDVELTADTFRFGFLTPAAFDNTVATGGRKDLVIKDCGNGNKITGAATLVDTTADPCF